MLGLIICSAQMPARETLPLLPIVLRCLAVRPLELVLLAARLAMRVLSSWLFVTADGAVTTRFCRLESFWSWSSCCWIKDSV